MNRINVLVLGLVLTLGLSGCIKDGDTFDPVAQYEIEKPIIQDYVESKYPAATLDANSGIWFQIIDPGQPGSYEYKFVNNQIENPTIKVKYSGWLLNGTKFDENQTEAGWTRTLGGTISAWQIAFLPKTINGEEVNGLTSQGLQKGAKIRIVTPSRWGYGNQTNGSIPANSPLDFEIEVLDIVPPSGSGN